LQDKKCRPSGVAAFAFSISNPGLGPPHYEPTTSEDSPSHPDVSYYAQYEAHYLFAERVVNFWAAAYGEYIMSIAEVKQLPFAEKLQIMEAIWEDLRVQAERVPVPQWHQDLLDERRKAVEEGREELLDWDSIKDSLPSRRKS
jgi:hypothetical protein